MVASLAGINNDFKSLSTLVGERYIDNHNMEPIQNIFRNDHRHPNEMKLIVMPAHMEAKQHWGLPCVDLQTWNNNFLV